MGHPVIEVFPEKVRGGGSETIVIIGVDLEVLLHLPMGQIIDPHVEGFIRGSGVEVKVEVSVGERGDHKLVCGDAKIAFVLGPPLNLGGQFG
jgi:hypothetical protein